MLILKRICNLFQWPQSTRSFSRPQQKQVSDKPLSDFVVDSAVAEAAVETKSNHRRYSQNRKMLKPFLIRTSFFRFLFSERKKIKAFARETGIIQLRNFDTKLLLNPLVLDVFPKNIHTITKELTKSLKNILEDGWYHLEKRDYNLVVLLNQLCRELSQVRFEKFSPKAPDLIDLMPAAELLFLILNYEPGDVKQIIYAVDTVFNKDPLKKDLQKETAVNIHKLLDRDQIKPSLYNLIIGLNIIKTRSFLQIKDLQKPSLQLIDNHEYNCTPKVRDKIDEYLRNLEKGIKPYLEHEKEVYRLHAFLPTDGNGVVDYSLLRHFYDTVLKSRGLIYDSNKDNIIKFILNLADAVLKSFKDILSETVELDSGKKARLFAPNIFGQDIQRIEFNLQKLDKIQTILPNFPTSRCLFIKKSTSGAIESEADAVRVIYEITSTIASMGKRIAHILRNTSPATGEDIEDKEIPFFSFEERAYTIPFENQKIVIDGFLRGFPVKEALFQIAGVCYQTGAFVQHSELTELLAKEKQIHDGIRVKVKQYRRIAHEKVYAAFRDKYDLSI